jgi:outer membrane protein OmpA-like peptidoglycan-associated protein
MTYRNTKIFLLTALVLTGAAGLARAEANYHDVVRDSEDQIVYDSFGSCVRTKWMVDRDACAPQVMAQQTVKQQIRRTVALTQEDRTVYFAFDHASLSPEAKDRLNTLVNALKSNESVKEARVVGYADRIGSVAYNQRLSQKRAETVRDYLIANGYTDARVTETRWVGKSEPSTNCPAAAVSAQLIECLHNDRRVEVEIGYKDDRQSSR